ncbi:uncharacterized protein HMPREF1541_03733 [Cyphellophora europaea CBS 101466]|uniref:Uncharacterized protein n=1 Tax=Cyphellophora europaea (strain CBS 101466) TaxID=1220924 RepID=W2RZ70_CYPE1|nr:uncharacterized protein HMPREF1541_03733 [Cyphellophora europaea CBS 101466]ETN41796.1 hypothetical protein HMPREF1541_03733 [Cyphellophora europaea CBS 101466]
MYFAAAYYRYSTRLIDGTIIKRPKVAVPILVTVRTDLDVVVGVMQCTIIHIQALIRLEHPRLGGVSLPETIVNGFRDILVAWDKIILLPSNIIRGVQDICFSSKGRFENCFERKTGPNNGYAVKPFMFKMSAQEAKETEGRLPEDDGPTIRAWMAAQRAHEERKRQEEEAQGVEQLWQTGYKWHDFGGTEVNMYG